MHPHLTPPAWLARFPLTAAADKLYQRFCYDPYFVQQYGWNHSTLSALQPDEDAHDAEVVHSILQLIVDIVEEAKRDDERMLGMCV